MDAQRVARPLSRQTPRTGSLLRNEGIAGYLFVAPALFLIVVIAFFPVAQSLWFSLLNYLPTFPQFGSQFVALDNYRQVFQDSLFIDSLVNTIIFMVVTVAFEFVLGLTFAIVLNQKFPGRGLARAAVLVPWAFPTVISAVVWRDLIWQNSAGVLPAFLHWLGVAPAGWAPLASHNTLILALIVIDVWKTAPFMALLLLAGLQTISDDVYEAGRVDGANAWQRFISLTLPLLKPTILVALLFRVLDAWRVFDLFYVIAGSRVQSISVFAFNEVVTTSLKFPQGVAASSLIFVGSIIIVVVFTRGFGAQTAS